jgi:3-isopropylmalate/(R)-2-methylmalate dehydratase small subunit
MNWLWRGRAWVFGDQIPNDNGLMPIRFVRAQEYDPDVLARHCFDDLEPGIAAQIKPGDIVVGGRNFGFGNPHIQGFLGLKGLGVAVLAESMSRGPLRACVNAGVPTLAPVAGISGIVSRGDDLEVDFAGGRITNLTSGAKLNTAPLSAVMQQIVAAGGGIGFMHQRLKAQAADEQVR